MTNFSINKKADNYKKNTGKGDVDGKTESPGVATPEDVGEEMSSKWSLQELKVEYEKLGINYEEVFKNVKLLCIKTLMAVEP